MTADEARAYLSSLSAHPERSYDTAYMHPDLARRLATAIQQARNEGMPVTLLSGVRQPSDHPSNYDLGGYSSHEYGLAADVAGIGAQGSATSARWRQIAEANGLSSPYAPTSSEWNHWQIGPKLEQAPQLLAALKTARATGNPGAVWNAYDSYAADTNRQPAVAEQPRATGTRFIDAVAQIESSNQDIYSNTDKDYPGQPGSRSQGYFQIDTPTWQQFAPRAGVDVAKYPQAKGAPREVQMAVAEAIPLHRFGKQTQEKLAKIFGPLDNNLTLGELNTKFGGGGTTQPPAGAAGGGGAASSPVASVPGLSPQQQQLASLGQSLGADLAGIGGGGYGGSSTGGSRFNDPEDQPAIRTPALTADFTRQTPNPVPANLAAGAGSSPVGQQLGALGAQAIDMFGNPVNVPSITDGAPGMTAMLGQVGTNRLDPLTGKSNPMNPYIPIQRLA